MKREVLELDPQAIDAMLERIKPAVSEDDFKLVQALARTVMEVSAIVRSANATLSRVRHLFGARSEKTAELKAKATPAPSPPPAVDKEPSGPGSGSDGATDSGANEANSSANASVGSSSPPESPAAAPKRKRKGHGRLPASAYLGAKHIAVCHESMRRGDSCPDCRCGKVYSFGSTPIVRIVGQAPLAAECWDCEQLRCGACGKVFTARTPAQAQGEKYDETASSMLAVLHCGTGVPFHRLEKIQANLGVPIPASTQWEVMSKRVEYVKPVYNELVRRAAQAEILHVDDSHMRILSLMGKRRAKQVAQGKLEQPERTGLFTTAIIAICATVGAIALFFTGRKHAGENLDDLLEKRAENLPMPLIMSDALSRNVPKGKKVTEANCIAHARRKVVDEIQNFPDECLSLLERLARVYHVDNECKVKGMSDDERLRTHQRDSAPIMQELKTWMMDLLEKKHVEPNSGLGQAFDYFLKRWEKFTVFLRVPGAPLDNNVCERALKMAIKLRKASLFYRSERGARVGDIYMTLIHTAELHHQNAFDYITELQRNDKAVAENPDDWLPWNYKNTLARIRTARQAGTDLAVAA